MGIRSCFLRCLILGFAGSVSAFAVEIGDAWQGPPAELGRPQGRIVVGEKTRYRWPELEVTVEGGRVVQIKRLDAASVAAETEERTKASVAERARLLAERKERTRLEAEHAEQERVAQIAREKAAAEAAAREAEEAERRRQAAQIEAERKAAEEAVKLAVAEREAREKAESDARARAEADALRRSQEDAVTRAAREKAEREARELAAAKARQAEAAEARRQVEAERKAAAQAKAEAKAKAEAEAQAKAQAEQKAAIATARLAPEESSGGVSLTKTPTDPVAKLEREITFLELDLRRAEAGSEPRERAEAGRLRAALREKRAQLEALRKKP